MCMHTHTLFLFSNKTQKFTIILLVSRALNAPSQTLFLSSFVYWRWRNIYYPRLSWVLFYAKVLFLFFFTHAIALSSAITDKTVVAESSFCFFLLWQNEHTHTHPKAKFFSTRPCFSKGLISTSIWNSFLARFWFYLCFTVQMWIKKKMPWRNFPPSKETFKRSSRSTDLCQPFRHPGWFCPRVV